MPQTASRAPMSQLQRPLPPETLNLYTAPQGYYLEPNYVYSVGEKPTVQILRPSGTILVNEPVSFNVPSKPTHNIYGVLGMIQLLSGPYLIVIKERTLACKLFGHYIWKITEAEILPCAQNFRSLTSQQCHDEEQFVSLLRGFLASDWLYYSSTWDLTRSIQRQVDDHQAASQRGSDLLEATMDMRFVVNRFIASPFVDILRLRTDTRLDDFMIFCIEGFVELEPLTVNNKRITFGLVSRRATGRVGTRYHSRGIDDNGNVSNFVETEQIVIVEDELVSFVQVRGSIPLFWRQNINIRYKPPLEFYNQGTSTAKVFAQHFAGLIDAYDGPVTAVNLVNNGGFEGHLAREYAKQARELAEPQLHYVPFDFNKQCPRMQWGRVSLLLDTLEPDLSSGGYFRGKLDRSQGEHRLAFTEVQGNQRGVIRTNCIDCLDRTNLVQGFIGRRLLTGQLRQMGVLQSDETVTDVRSLETLFRQIWADNGDAISKQYSGTGALKADFTRTGRRTKWGLVADGLNSLIRYYLNNFSDGQRQDAMDLFYGHYTVHLDEYYSPFIYEFNRQLLIAPIVLGFCLVLLIWQGLVSRAPQVAVTLFALLAVLLSGHLIMREGIHYVQYPRLRPPPVAARIHPLSSGPSALFGRGLHQRLFNMVMPSRKVHII